MILHALHTSVIVVTLTTTHARRLKFTPALHDSPLRSPSRSSIYKGHTSMTVGGDIRQPAVANCTRDVRLVPYPFQEEAIKCLLAEGRRGLLLGDEMGLGKTASVIGALNREPSIERVLVITPKSVVSVWRFEFSRWLERSLSVGVVTAARGISQEHHDILLMNYDIVQKYREELDELAPWDLVVCDEAHYLKNPETIRTRSILGDTMGMAIDDAYASCPGALQTKRVWFLSGSPILNTPMELFPLLRTLDPFGETVPALQSYADFSERYTFNKTNRRGYMVKGARNTAELRRLLYDSKTKSPLLLRRTKAQVLVDLPSKRHSLLPFADEDVVRKEMQVIAEEQRKNRENQKQFENSAVPIPNLDCGPSPQLIVQQAPGGLGAISEFSSWLPLSTSGGELENVIATWNSARFTGEFEMPDDDESTLGILASARHQTALAKVPLVIDLLKAASATHKVVVFAHHRDVQKNICDHFKVAAVTINGDTKPEERLEAVRRFQEDDEVRIFVGSIRAAGVGITLTAASHVIFVEFDWSPMIMQQAEDRCHRIGQRNSVLIQYVYFEGTIDEILARSLSRKMTTISAVLDGGTDNSTAYTFDFGKYKGESLFDVAASNSGYLDWLVEIGAHEERPMLRNALKLLGKLSESTAPSTEADQKEKAVEGTGDLEYVFDFGKYKGEAIQHVEACDPSYLEWLGESGAYRKRPALRNALRALGRLPVRQQRQQRREGEHREKNLHTEHDDEGIPDEAREDRKAEVDAPATAPNVLDYIFQSGKHQGEKLIDVVDTDPAYLDLLITEGLHKTRPRLSEALNELGRLRQSLNKLGTLKTHRRRRRSLRK